MPINIESEVMEENEQVENRKNKLLNLRKTRKVAFLNNFQPTASSRDLIKKYDNCDHDYFEKEVISVKVAGRIMTRRIMGKASFITIKDNGEKIQIYLKKDNLPDGIYEDFKNFDLGDIVGIYGDLFKTKTGELTVKARDIVILTKSLRPLPDKFHGFSNPESKYRQRYLDLIANDDSRKVFEIRAQVIDSIRAILKEKEFLEVETPMMHTLAGGATARPFVTHHNTFDMDLYMRIAPELYLKRLVVGGFDRVFEINRNFRNEGVSTRHNPEFTTVEFYQAYATYETLMNFTQEMMRRIARDVFGTTTVKYMGEDVDLGKPFVRMTVLESILHFNPQLTLNDLSTKEKAVAAAQKLGVKLNNIDDIGLGKVQIEIFEKTVEKNLLQPTFITKYPKETSPLARINDDDDFVTDRFEFFIGGRELANGFSELNDPIDQAERFRKQMQEKAKGDEEAMPYDEDYVTALEYGMPPTAGEGIGIDRLVMFFADQPSIRDVILFPLLRPEVRIDKEK